MFNMTTRNYVNEIASVEMWYASDSIDAPARLQIESPKARDNKIVWASLQKRFVGRIIPDHSPPFSKISFPWRNHLHAVLIDLDRYFQDSCYAVPILEYIYARSNLNE